MAINAGLFDSSQPKLWPVDTRSNVQLVVNVELRLTTDSNMSEGSVCVHIELAMAYQVNGME